MWEYFIEDNFLSSDNHQSLLELEISDQNNSVKRDNKEIFLRKTFAKNDNYDDENSLPLFEELHAELENKILNFFKNSREHLVKYFKVDGFRYTLIETQPSYVIPFHTEPENVLLSIVIYLGENNIGTIIAEDQKGTGEKEIKWRDNRALIFFNEKDATWHSVRTSQDRSRKVLVIFVVEDINGECE